MVFHFGVEKTIFYQPKLKNNEVEIIVITRHFTKYNNFRKQL